MKGDRYGVQVLETITVTIDYYRAYPFGYLSNAMADCCKNMAAMKGYGLLWHDYGKGTHHLQVDQNQKSAHDISEASEEFGKHNREVMLKCD